eukprot:TRINITY_DN67468_c8_g3_i2.p1 TRINITY_DN67468_c8_g3~~TRINITY_DN67468_c8_g3_i2.p1  ORF type:complete len:650 (+),score=363.64 TRINITY_DN67468_c8_g3_i2:60-1952(+)
MSGHPGKKGGKKSDALSALRERIERLKEKSRTFHQREFELAKYLQSVEHHRTASSVSSNTSTAAASSTVAASDTTALTAPSHVRGSSVASSSSIGGSSVGREAADGNRLSEAEQATMQDILRIQWWLVSVKRNRNFNKFASVISDVKNVIFTPQQSIQKRSSSMGLASLGNSTASLGGGQDERATDEAAFMEHIRQQKKSGRQAAVTNKDLADFFSSDDEEQDGDDRSDDDFDEFDTEDEDASDEGGDEDENLVSELDIDEDAIFNKAQKRKKSIVFNQDEPDATPVGVAFVNGRWISEHGEGNELDDVSDFDESEDDGDRPSDLDELSDAGDDDSDAHATLKSPANLAKTPSKRKDGGSGMAGPASIQIHEFELSDQLRNMFRTSQVQHNRMFSGCFTRDSTADQILTSFHTVTNRMHLKWMVHQGEVFYNAVTDQKRRPVIPQVPGSPARPGLIEDSDLDALETSKISMFSNASSSASANSGSGGRYNSSGGGNSLIDSGDIADWDDDDDDDNNNNTSANNERKTKQAADDDDRMDDLDDLSDFDDDDDSQAMPLQAPVAVQKGGKIIPLDKYSDANEDDGGVQGKKGFFSPDDFKKMMQSSSSSSTAAAAAADDDDGFPDDLDDLSD